MFFFNIVGAFAARFVDSGKYEYYQHNIDCNSSTYLCTRLHCIYIIGAAIRIGNIANILNEIRDVFCIICNTIMTANTVVDMTKRPQPVIWILHEWWDDQMIQDNLAIRNMKGLSLETVKMALAQASM